MIMASVELYVPSGQSFRKNRIRHGFGMRQFANMAGMIPSELCNVENGRRLFTAIELETIKSRFPALFQEWEEGAVE